MRTYPSFVRWAAAAVAGLALLASPASGQQRRYLIEAGAAGTYTSFDEVTNLEGGIGGLGRIGVWLPYRLSLEGELSLASPKAGGAVDWSVRTLSAALLGNLPIGLASSAYLKAGVGSSKYDSDLCVGDPPRSVLAACGNSSVLLGGIGARAALSPTIMVRGELGGTRSISGRAFTNLGASVGISYMIGSRPLTDTDRDGVFDSQDRCRNTQPGILVDARGCPSDTDRDGVPDGVDRCPTTSAGSPVNAVGCPRDADGDNVADSDDRCANTAAGAAVDANGCPTDEDRDGILDGLDRCSATPQGATVDQLGCPGDEDGDGVLDGLDRCPRTPAGSTVNTFGCPPNTPVPPAGARPGAAAPGPGALALPAPGTPLVLPGVTFSQGSARLRPEASPVLDSLAALLLAEPAVSVEIGGHTDGTRSESMTLSRLRAEAVRNYLIGKKVPFTRLTARGYGATARIDTADTAAARAANRRIELRVLPPAPGP
jgi:outer membrane protein OmpA-like peptidoglycan-associated protein